jgi:hypothetical protein
LLTLMIPSCRDYRFTFSQTYLGLFLPCRNCGLIGAYLIDRGNWDVELLNKWNLVPNSQSTACSTITHIQSFTHMHTHTHTHTVLNTLTYAFTYISQVFFW